VKGVVHWASQSHGVPCEVRDYDRLFAAPVPADVPEGEDWKKNLNPSSLETLSSALAEPALAGATAGSQYQFERLGYYIADRDGAPTRPVFNRTVTLRDTWSKEQAKE
jgi:glutaminyl-tRNA synthetase